MKLLIFSLSIFLLIKSSVLFAAPKDMALIPAGDFQMGSDKGQDDEKPIHAVYLDAYFIDKYEVTQKAYEKEIGENPSKFKGDNRPVENITWYQAKDYCEKVGKRLPTEAEWEKAARAGKNSIYPWGDKPDPTNAWFGKSWLHGHFPVGKKNPNAFGLYDMIGNVWEWTNDWYEAKYFESSPKKNPQGAKVGPSQSEGGYLVTKGGAWGNNSQMVRTAKRYKIRPYGQRYQIGFRCAKSK